MLPLHARRLLALSSMLALTTCARQDVREAPSPTGDAGEGLRTTAALLPAASGCAPGARCLSVTGSGRPAASGSYVAQCRGKFADFIVPKDTLPSGYDGPWFRPNPLEQAFTGVPSGSRPWRAFDPRDPDERLA